MASCCSENSLLSIDQALQRMSAAIHPVRESENIKLTEAVDKILSEDIVSGRDVPLRNNSAMDGYALCSSDKGPLRVLGKALAGRPFDGHLVPGTCVKITTGATIPSGADAVVMQENVKLEGNSLYLTRSVTENENIRFRGEDIAEGQRLLSSGTRLSPTDIAIAASLGFDRVPVFRNLKVAVFSTGDEVVLPGQTPAEGQIYDSNRYGIIALLTRLGAEIEDCGLVGDRHDEMTETFLSAAARSDAIVCSGGVSVGEADYVKTVLTQVGNIEFWKVAMKPGKPFAFGRISDCIFFGLPGNPVSALVTLHQLAVPVLRRMAGENVTESKIIQATAASSYRKRRGRIDFQRGSLTPSPSGVLEVSSAGAQGSGILSSFIGANCYVVLEQERENVMAGEIVHVLPFDRFLQ